MKTLTASLIFAAGVVVALLVLMTADWVNARYSMRRDLMLASELRELRRALVVIMLKKQADRNSAGELGQSD
ncbi:MAG: hypothetical protein ACPGVG_15780 [Mycobacterium sp.]